MSEPVEGKPYRLVDWCVQHDSPRAETTRSYPFCQLVGAADPDEIPQLAIADCRFHKLELRQHGYEKIEWGEQ